MWLIGTNRIHAANISFEQSSPPTCPIRNLLRVIRENMRAVRLRPVFHDYLRACIGAVPGLVAGHRRRQNGLHAL